MNEHDLHLPELLQRRDVELKKVPENLSDEEREIAWITNTVREVETDGSDLDWIRDDLLCHYMSDAEIEAMMEWNEKDWTETIERQQVKMIIDCERQAKEGIKAICEAFNAVPTLILDRTGPAPYRVNQEVKKAIEVLRDHIDQFCTEPVTGNYSTNRAYVIKMYWGILRTVGYSMRNASSILAAAFERAGKEHGDLEKRADSIRLVIRTYETQRRRELMRDAHRKFATGRN